MQQFGCSGWVLSRHLLRWGSLFCVLMVVVGCSRLRPKPPVTWVYVTAKQTFLRDRVAAVSNRTATVANGDKLQVLDHGRRFIKVQTAKGEQGWIDEKAVATEQVYGLFEALGEQHKNDPSVASAVVQDEVYLHARPGLDAERFFLLEEGAKLQMLQRATLPKPLPPGTKPAKVAPAASAGAVRRRSPPPVMQDWWLVRDAQGHTGWILAAAADRCGRSGCDREVCGGPADRWGLCADYGERSTMRRRPAGQEHPDLRDGSEPVQGWADV